MSIEYGLQLPRLGPESDEPIEVDGLTDFYASPHQLVEYAGMLALSCDREQKEYLNTWFVSGHTIDVGSALVVRLKGMFSCELVKGLFRKLK